MTHYEGDPTCLALRESAAFLFKIPIEKRDAFWKAALNRRVENLEEYELEHVYGEYSDRRGYLGTED